MGGNPHQKDSKEKSCPWPSRAINHATSSSIHRTALLPFKSQQSRDLQICLSIHLSRAHAFQKVTGMDAFSQEPSCICSPLVHVCICNKWFAWFTNLHIVPVISSSHPLRQLQSFTSAPSYNRLMSKTSKASMRKADRSRWKVCPTKTSAATLGKKVGAQAHVVNHGKP